MEENLKGHCASLYIRHIQVVMLGASRPILQPWSLILTRVEMPIASIAYAIDIQRRIQILRVGRLEGALDCIRNRHTTKDQTSTYTANDSRIGLILPEEIEDHQHGRIAWVHCTSLQIHSGILQHRRRS